MAQACEGYRVRRADVMDGTGGAPSWEPCQGWQRQHSKDSRSSSSKADWKDSRKPSKEILGARGRPSVQEGGHGNTFSDDLMSGLRMFRRGSTGSCSVTSVHSDSSEKVPDKKKQEGGGMFVSKEAMKEKVRANLSKPKYDVAMYYHETGLWRTIATHPVFEKVTLAVIAVNAIWIGVDTDHNKSDTLLGAKPTFQVAEQLFCLFFSFEWFSRFMSFKRKRDGLKDGWFVFDSALVFMMVMETWVLTVVMLASGGAGSGGMSNASILRMARLARLSRMARMARLLRAMPELMILIKGIVAATRSVFFTLALLCLLMYVFAIAFTQLTVDTEVGKEFFNEVGDSMYTLLVYGTLMDNITAPLSKLGKEHLLFGGLFLLFVLLAALTLMNMLIGVLTEVVSAVAATEKETLTVTFVRNKMEKVLKTIDKDSDGKISKVEFVKILENKEATEALNEVDVDVVNLVDFADFIFDDAQEDGDGADGTLEFSKFMEVVLQFRGSNHATVKDIVNLRKFVSSSLKSQRDELFAIHKMVKDRKSMLSARSSLGNKVKAQASDAAHERARLAPEAPRKGSAPHRDAPAVGCPKKRRPEVMEPARPPREPPMEHHPPLSRLVGAAPPGPPSSAQPGAAMPRPPQAPPPAMPMAPFGLHGRRQEMARATPSRQEQASPMLPPSAPPAAEIAIPTWLVPAPEAVPPAPWRMSPARAAAAPTSLS